MPVGFRSASDLYGTGTNITVPEPAGAAQNDVFVALIIAGAAATLSAPTGWTSLYSGANASFDWLVCWIARGASAPDLTFVVSTSVFRQASLGAFTGVNTSSPFSATANGGGAVVQNPDPPSAGPGATDGMAVALCAHWSGATPFVAPTGYTLRTRTAELSDNGYATKPLSSTAAEDPSAFTGPTEPNDSYSATLLLQPSAATVTTTTNLRPNATISNNWTVNGVASAHLALQDAVVQPADPSANTGNISTGTAGNVSEVGVDDKALGASETVSDAVLWVHLGTGAKRGHRVALLHDSTVLATADFPTQSGWQSVTYTGSLTQTQVNDLRCRLTCYSTAGGGGAGTITGYAAYIALTTTAPAVESTPIAGSDSLTLTESLVVSSSSTRTDTLILGEDSSIIFAVTTGDDADLVTEDVVVVLSQYAREDSLSMTDAPATRETQESKAVTEGYVITEAVPSLSQGRSVTEAHVLTDVGAVAATLSREDAVSFAEAVNLSQSRAAADALALTDNSSLSTLLNLSVVDTFLWTETNALSVLLSRVDSDALAEALSIAASVGMAEQITWEDVSTVTSNTFLAGSDSTIQLDAATVLSVLALIASDQLTVADSSLLSAAVAAVDSAVQAEAQALSVSLSRTDALAVADSATLVRTLAVVGADSMSVSELADVAGALQSSDESALSELGALSAEDAISAFDNLVWLGEQTFVNVGGLPAKIDLPTRAAVVAWAATVVLTAINLGVEASLHQATVELVGNIKGVSIATSKTSVEITPNRTSVSLG